MDNIFELEKITKQNKYYREVIYTTDQLQLVLMSLRYMENIGKEIHPCTTQFIRVESGYGNVYIDGKVTELNAGDCVVIAAGMEHDIKSLSRRGMKLYTIYSPPEHDPDTLQETKS
jgi:mannose-6-phosphate isomerase-like protein (cupin superfamily)